MPANCSTMKRVVMLAAQFPPCNLAAVHRARLFSAHLADHGWEPHIVTVRPEFYEGERDEELERLLPACLKITRTSALPTRPVRLIGDIGLRSLAAHYRVVRDLARRRLVDLLFISMGPYYASLIGPLIYSRYGVPYAIDYQDPWVVRPSPGSSRARSKAWLSYQLSRTLEPLVLRHASLVSGVAPGYFAGAIERNPWLSRRQSITLPIGAEPADYSYLDAHPRPPTAFDPHDGNFHLVYVGVLWPAAIDTFDALLVGLRLACNADASARRIRLDFIGTRHGGASQPGDESTLTAMARRIGVEQQVHEYAGRMPYVDALNHLRHADAVLVLGSDEPHYTPSKIFPAVLAGRPLLTILHAASTAADLVAQANVGPLVRFDGERPVSAAVEEISTALLSLLHGHAYDPKRVDWHSFEPFTASALTGQLAAAFDRAIASHACGDSP